MRLLTLNQIRAEKFPRSRSYIFALVAEGKFPKPLDTGTMGGPNVWLESDVDRFVENLVTASKEREAKNPTQSWRRTERATAALAAKNRASRQTEAVPA